MDALMRAADDGQVEKIAQALFITHSLAQLCSHVFPDIENDLEGLDADVARVSEEFATRDIPTDLLESNRRRGISFAETFAGMLAESGEDAARSNCMDLREKMGDVLDEFVGERS